MKAYLLGFRGAGKTTLGRLLAAELGCRFLDLDEEWEKREGMSILEFVEARGMAAFRESEGALLRETAALPAPALVATGGGVVDFPPSLEFLASSPWEKIYLELDSDTLWQRLQNAPERRKIGGLSSPEALSKLLAERRPLYEKIATYTVRNRDITQALTEIKQRLSQ